ncbi:MAG: 50S ribosomal protein L30e [Thermoplasmata archaeon]
MDINREIRLAVNTGKTVFGVKESKEAASSEKARLVIVSNKCPETEFKGDQFQGVPIYHYKGNNKNLGTAAGKPFSISALTVIKAGESNILSVKG